MGLVFQDTESTTIIAEGFDGIVKYLKEHGETPNTYLVELTEDEKDFVRLNISDFIERHVRNKCPSSLTKGLNPLARA